MEREPLTLHHSANDFDDRNDFLHLLLGLVSVSRTVTDLLGGNPHPDDPAAPGAARTADAPPPARDLLC
jgi:hypothetical protein